MSDQRLSPEERSRQNVLRRASYREEAETYDREAAFAERWFFGSKHRGWACSMATGRTLEVAIGTGLNLPLYPAAAAVTGIDLTPEMLAIAGQRAAELGRPVELILGDAQELPFSDSTFDTIVSTYAMCSVPDLVQTIGEMHRVLKRGGRLILVDHIRSSMRPIFWIQRLMERSPKRTGGELTRRPLVQVEAAGFEIEASDRSRGGMIERLVARRTP
jgi:ubiquinone/menaquinone biosynthesis C-methylase UbiE